MAVRLNQIGGRATSVKAPQQNRGRRLHHGAWSVSEDIGQPDVRGVLAKADRMRQIGVGMIFDHEVRRAALATKTRVNALKNSLTTRHRSFPV